jgi:uncharacterized damage-inducible protein DinB
MALLVPPVSDERDGLLKFLSGQREALKAAVFELDRDQATSTPSVSALSLAGLIKHVANTERSWVAGRLAGRDVDIDYQNSFQLNADQSVDDVIAFYDEVAAETEAIVRELPNLEVPVPVPQGVPWFPNDVEAWSARWVLLHCIEETARHAGHADIVRESIDGSNAYVLLAKYRGEVPDYLAAYIDES